MTTTISFWLMLAHLRMMLRPVAPVDGCRWIEGDYFVERMRRGEEIYCNAPVRRFGESYCTTHWARVYTDPCSRYHGIDRQTTARARRLSICAPSNQPQTAIPVEILHSNEMIVSRLDLIGLPSSVSCIGVGGIDRCPKWPGRSPVRAGRGRGAAADVPGDPVADRPAAGAAGTSVTGRWGQMRQMAEVRLDEGKATSSSAARWTVAAGSDLLLAD
jgi:hypothetical protein